MVVGRVNTADIVVADPLLSRSHFELFAVGDEWLLRDLGSKNGTSLNGTDVATDTKVVSNDRIRAGSTQFNLVIDRRIE